MNRLLLLSALAVPAFCSELATTLMPPSGPLAAGSVVQLDLVSVNPGSVEASFSAPAHLIGTIETNTGTWPVSLEGATSAPLTVAAGGFGVRHYRLELPPAAKGRAVLAVSSSREGALHAVFDILHTPAELEAVEPSAPLADVLSSSPAASSIARNFAGRFLPNQPVYFIYGDAAQAAKFQFSFDYRMATIAHDDGSLGTLRVGYTQRSVWDIEGDSSPFYDTSYMPEIAYSSDRAMPVAVAKWFTWLGWRVAIQHESNGKEGAESRSLNTAYLRPRFVLGTLGKWAFVMLPEVHVYLGESGENPDIDEYRGHGKLRFYFGHNEGPSLMFSGWAGKDLDHSTYQLDLAVPLQVRWLNLETYVYAQYFNGYGESLRAYRTRSDAFRFGFSLVR